MGSISHSENKAIAIVSGVEECLGLGVDIQDYILPSERDSIVNLILNAQEQFICQEMPSDISFDIFFSAKESLYKALYPRSLDLFEHMDVEIIRVNESNSTLELRLLRNLKAYWLKGQTFTIHYIVASGYVLTWMYIYPESTNFE